MSCSLLDVTDNEAANSGRGAKLFDPYQGLNSGALRLSLQYYNGCALLPNGLMVKKNSAAIPYPDLCPTPLDPFNALGTMTPPQGTLTLVTNTPYFLNQFTVTQMVINQHNNPKDLSPALNWVKTQSWMKKLNWNNAAASPSDWSFVAGFPGVFQDAWTREVRFEHPDWERVKDDFFTIEVLDRDGTVRSSVNYQRSELLVGSPFAGHSRAAWRMEDSGAPLFPGDVEPHPLTVRPGNLPQVPSFKTMARLDLFGSTNPFKTFTTPSDAGDGAIRVTWSQMPDDPFYFPVTFVAKGDIEANCFDDAGQPQPCSFGVDPKLAIAPPTEGSFYKPGETVKLTLDVRDNEGHRLHKPDSLPSVAEIVSQKNSGLLTFESGLYGTTLEADFNTVVGISGPLQELKTRSSPQQDDPEKTYVGTYTYMIDQLAGTRVMPGAFRAPPSTHVKFVLPPDAKKGTYVAFAKASRYFMGERLTKMQPFFFQVGQDEETEFPAQIGNCQICHKGVLSLDNLRHGLAVDYVEGCKTCHHSDDDRGQRMQETIHRLHMNSPKFTAAKNDCTICHLTKKSATRPSLATCSSCHPSQHGDKYFNEAFSNAEPGRFSNCAQSCHADQTPKLHILPEN